MAGWKEGRWGGSGEVEERGERVSLRSELR